MTDILQQIESLPQDIKTQMYGFIHIEDRITMLKQQYYNKLISDENIWYQYVNFMGEELLESFNAASCMFPNKLGYFPSSNPSSRSWCLVPNEDRPILYGKNFPKLTQNIYYSRNEVKTVNHPLYDDFNSFIKCKFSFHSDERWENLSSRRNPPKTYHKYLIINRGDIKRNYTYQYNLINWKAYDIPFDNAYSKHVFSHLLSSIVCINQPKVLKQLEHAKHLRELEQIKKQKERQERDRMYRERNEMHHEDRLSRKRQKTMTQQFRRLLQQQKVARLELEAAERKERRIAERRAIEIQRAEEKEVKRLATLRKKEEKEHARKLKEKLARQKEQDKMLASTVKIMQDMFKPAKVQKPTINRAAQKAQKAQKEKLARQREQDRMIASSVKIMLAMFKPTRKTKQSKK